MKRAGNKLRSEGGASLMMALLLFLVCAVLGSVVLVAGTASSGRLANLAEMEQHYYAVNSAAELLRNGLCGKENETVLPFQRVKTLTTSTPIIVNADGSVIEGESTTGDPVYKNILPPVSAEDPGAKLRYLLACFLVFGTNEVSEIGSEEQFQYEANEELQLPEITITVDGKEDMQVDVTPVLQPHGQLLLKLKNHKGTDKYQLDLLLSAQSEPEISSAETTETKTESGSIVLTQMQTTTKTNKVLWQFVGLQLEEESEEGSGA